MTSSDLRRVLSVCRVTLRFVNIPVNSASDVLKAVRIDSVPGGAARGPVVMAVLSVLRDGVDDKATGVSWRDEREATNALLVTARQIVHAVVPSEGEPHATVYTSEVSAVEAAGIVERDTGFGTDLTWGVRAWHVTLHDGTVITLTSSDTSHGDVLSDFVREHFLP